MASPTKKKSRKSLNEREALSIIRDHGRNLKAAAESIVFEHFMTVPEDELPTTDFEELKDVAEKIRKKLGEL